MRDQSRSGEGARRKDTGQARIGGSESAESSLPPKKMEKTQMTGAPGGAQRGAAAESEVTSAFVEFQKVEYARIAEAHFKAIEAITFFFRYYLLVMSLPVSIAAVLFSFAARGLDFDRATVITLFEFTSPILMVVGFVGFCMLMYIINIKMDVVLYSRVVNSIRKFFYDLYDSDHTNKMLMRQLPQSASIPAYGDMPFGFVVLAFALFDTLYISFGVHLLITIEIGGASSVNALGFGGYSRWEMLSYSIAVTAAFAAHFLAYYLFSRYREYAYLRATAIGIDIDGVLDQHREKFCEMAASKLNKQLRPQDIKMLPVHENTGLNPPITRADERAIFNDPQYWVEMPVLDGAAEAIKTIRDSYLLPVHIFTHRPWPDLSAGQGATREEMRDLRRSWRIAADGMARRANVKECVRQWVNLVTAVNFRTSIRYITKYWLRMNGIVYDSLLVEKGNENIVYSRGRFENRFNYAKRKRIKFFVEDDWVKAIKLSYICDLVFLIAHPYNQGADGDPLKHENELIIGRLPANVLRIDSWSYLKKAIAQLV
jgi:uncharacterized HAD superfamily protein